MAQVVSFNSRLVYGHVGGEGGGFVLRRLGHEVWQVPSVLFSNHPAHGGFVGRVTPADEIEALLNGLVERNLLRHLGAMLSGYLRAPKQAKAIGRFRDRHPDICYLCDPVLGDNGALYIPEDTAVKVREILLPRADIVTPNRFELAYLSGRPADTLDEVVAAARSLLELGPKLVVCTSAETTAASIATLAVGRDRVLRAETPILDNVPHGTGDAFAALFLGRYLLEDSVEEVLSLAVASIYGIARVRDPQTPGELAIVKGQEEFVAPTARFPVTRIA